MASPFPPLEARSSGIAAAITAGRRTDSPPTATGSATPRRMAARAERPTSTRTTVAPATASAIRCRTASASNDPIPLPDPGGTEPGLGAPGVYLLGEGAVEIVKGDVRS